MITSTTNAKIKWVRQLQARRAARAAERLFVIEGVRLAEEAARAAAAPRLVLHTAGLDLRGQDALAALAPRAAAVEAVSPAVLAAASDTRTPAGLLAVLPQPALPLPSPLTFALILDALADPGNLGTILRTALAAGVEAVFLAPGAVDAFNPKVVRAAVGAHFHLPLVTLEWESLPARLAGLAVWRAEAQGGVLYDRVDWTVPSALLIGAEAAGPGPQARALAPRTTRIPMPGPAESLNAAAAAAVLLFEAARQRSARLEHTGQ
jgi:TrmH family RNA methyltransferase